MNAWMDHAQVPWVTGRVGLDTAYAWLRMAQEMRESCQGRPERFNLPGWRGRVAQMPRRLGLRAAPGRGSWGISET